MNGVRLLYSLEEKFKTDATDRGSDLFCATQSIPIRTRDRLGADLIYLFYLMILSTKVANNEGNNKNLLP